MIDVELLQFRHHLTQIVGWRRSQMEPTDQRVNFFDTRHFSSARQRIDDARVAAGTQHDQAAVAEIEARRMLVPMLIRHRLPGEFVGREMMLAISVRVASGAILYPVRDLRVWQYSLDTGARHCACR